MKLVQQKTNNNMSQFNIDSTGDYRYNNVLLLLFGPSQSS